MWQLAPAYMHAPVFVYVHTHTHSNVGSLCVCIGVDWCLMFVYILDDGLLYVCVIHAGMYVYYMYAYMYMGTYLCR